MRFLKIKRRAACASTVQTVKSNSAHGLMVSVIDGEITASQEHTRVIASAHK